MFIFLFSSNLVLRYCFYYFTFSLGIYTPQFSMVVISGGAILFQHKRVLTPVAVLIQCRHQPSHQVAS